MSREGKLAIEQRRQLLEAVNDLLDRASDAEAAGPIPGNPSDYTSPIEMTCAMLRSIRFQDPAEAEGAAEQVRELVDELAVANAKLTELAAAAAEKKEVRDVRPILGFDTATGRALVQIPGGAIVPGYPAPRQAGKAPHLRLERTAIEPRKSEAEIRNEVLTKVIDALQLGDYGFRTDEERANPFTLYVAEPKLDPEGFWADIESTLADRAEDAEYDRVEAARKRIESITGVVDETEPEEFALAGEKLADAA